MEKPQVQNADLSYSSYLFLGMAGAIRGREIRPMGARELGLEPVPVLA